MLLTATGFLNDFDALKEAQLKTINIQSAAALPQRQKEVIWNVLGLWGPLGGKKRDSFVIHTNCEVNGLVERDSQLCSLGGYFNSHVQHNCHED